MTPFFNTKMDIPETIRNFIVPEKSFEPIYLDTLRRGNLQEKIEKARSMLFSCRVCPRNCDVNRVENRLGICAVGRFARVASWFPHHGEEDCLRGWRGSGTIFFAGCNLKCVFCQNFDISRSARAGQSMTCEDIAKLMLHLQDSGCHNINLVTPEHVVPQLVEAIALAVKNGLSIPIVYNTSAYDSPESLALMHGLIDIYMPDFKYWNPDKARRYLGAQNYPQVARESIKIMHQQVGDLVFNEYGLALRGMLVRHLVMPEGLDDSRMIFHWLAQELGQDTYVNIMDQYHPTALVNEKRYPELHRVIPSSEYKQAVILAREQGLWRLDTRWQKRNRLHY